MLGGINETDLALLLARSSYLPALPSLPRSAWEGLAPLTLSLLHLPGLANNLKQVLPLPDPRRRLLRPPGSPGLPINPILAQNLSPGQWLRKSLAKSPGQGWGVRL